MGHRGKDMTCTKVVMADHKCSPLWSIQDKSRHLQMLRVCLHDHRETIQSIGQHLPARLLHLNLLPGHLEHTPLVSRQNIPAASGTAKNKYHRDCGLAPIAGDVKRRIECSQWEQWFVGPGWCRTQNSNQSEAYWILIEAFCQMDGAGQLLRIEQVEESMGGRVSGVEGLLYYPEEELFETGWRWTPALGHIGHRLVGNIWELATVV